jgi:hypothetical protein
MLAKCVNPSCQVTFRYRHEGKLFVVPKRPSVSPVGNPDTNLEASRLDYYWLCHRCASRMELCFQEDKGMLLVPLNQAHQEWPMT